MTTTLAEPTRLVGRSESERRAGRARPGLLDNRFATASARAFSYQRLGATYDPAEKLTAIEALRASNQDHGLEKVPVYARVGGRSVQIEDKVALWQRPHDGADGKIVSIVGTDYPFLTNYDLARMLNPLSTYWPVLSVGQTGDGTRVFFNLFGGNVVVGGDEHHVSFVISDARDGKNSMRLALMVWRQVCKNGLLAWSDLGSASLWHTSSFRVDAEFTTRLVSSLRLKQSEVLRMYAAMTDSRIADAEVQALIRRLYPDPKRPRMLAVYDAAAEEGKLDQVVGAKERLAHATEAFEYERDRVVNLREGVWGRYEVFNAENPETAGTRYAALNTITEVESFRRGKAGAAEATLFGDRARTTGRAFALLAARA